MRQDVLVKSAFIGIVAMLIILFTLMMTLSVIDRENQMQKHLQKFGDQSFWSTDYLDVYWLLGIGILAILFAGGMAATILTYSGEPNRGRWLTTSRIVAVFTVILIDSYVLYAWSQNSKMDLSIILIFLLFITIAFFGASSYGERLAKMKIDYMYCQEKK